MLPATLTDHLKRITTPGTGFLNGAVARLSPEGALDTFAHGRRRPGDAPGELEPDRMRVRVASVTKAATAHVACRLAVAGVVDLDDALAHALGVEPTGPQPTLRQLLNHSSGLRDARGYITEPPGTVRDLLTDALPPATPPGAYFEYANLNYVLLGAALEVATGERLDHLMRREVMERIGARGGLNWAGVAAADRADRLPLYQRHGDALVLEADGDGAAWDADLIWRGGRGLSLDGYRTGLDTGLLSPHAGLRLTVGEMARLARLFGEDSAAARLQRRETWRYDGTNGAWCDGLFPAFGLGLTLTPGDDRIPGRLAGHAGHALGFTGGAWVNLDTGTAWAYALTGSADLTEDSDQEVFYPEPELAILEHF